MTEKNNYIDIILLQEEEVIEHFLKNVEMRNLAVALMGCTEDVKEKISEKLGAEYAGQIAELSAGLVDVSDAEISSAELAVIKMISDSRYALLQLGAMCDMRYALDHDVRKLQVHLAAGGTFEEAVTKLGMDFRLIQLISNYLRYRERHIYDEEIIEFDEWKAHRLAEQ